jgi:membrane protease YdiL (CAAX protease family)
MRNRSEPFPTAYQAFLLYVALVLCEVVVSSALRDANGMLGLSREQHQALTVLLGNGCVFALVMHFRNITYRSLFHDSPSSVKATLALIVPPVLLLVPALLMFMGYVQELLVRIAPLSAWEEQFFERVGANDIATVLAVCVLAPVLEEMLFRGIVLRGFLERYSRSTAIIGSAVLFGAVHLNMYQFLVGLVAGTILGWLYERTRSLIPCIALHGAYNSGTIVLTSLAQSTNGELSFEAVLSMWSASLAAAACGALALRRMLTNRAGRRLPEQRGS